MTPSSTARRLAAPWLLLAAAWLAPGAPAQVHKCKQPDGSLAYQQAPCPDAIKVVPARQDRPKPAATEAPGPDPYAKDAPQRAALADLPRTQSESPHAPHPSPRGSVCDLARNNLHVTTVGGNVVAISDETGQRRRVSPAEQAQERVRSQAYIDAHCQ